MTYEYDCQKRGLVACLLHHILQHSCLEHVPQIYVKLPFGPCFVRQVQGQELLGQCTIIVIHGSLCVEYMAHSFGAQCVTAPQSCPSQ
jgi:hypothetical protein